MSDPLWTGRLPEFQWTETTKTSENILNVMIPDELLGGHDYPPWFTGPHLQISPQGSVLAGGQNKESRHIFLLPAIQK